MNDWKLIRQRIDAAETAVKDDELALAVGELRSAMRKIQGTVKLIEHTMDERDAMGEQGEIDFTPEPEKPAMAVTVDQSGVVEDVVITLPQTATSLSPDGTNGVPMAVSAESAGGLSDDLKRIREGKKGGTDLDAPPLEAGEREMTDAEQGEWARV